MFREGGTDLAPRCKLYI